MDNGCLLCYILLVGTISLNHYSLAKKKINKTPLRRFLNEKGTPFFYFATT